MTHDELLAKIDIWKFQTKGYDDTYEVHGILNALRAAVELHKPSQSYLFDDEVCDSCSSEEDRSEILYPCPTIQAIEKELG
jgi:hypothetical protein